MKVDHTKAVEKSVEAIPITILDGCSFYEPKEHSLLAVKLCAFCKFGAFADQHRNGYCQYRVKGTQEVIK